jgi:hypothetical protein
MNAEFGYVLFINAFSFEPVSQGAADLRLDLCSIFKEKPIEFGLIWVARKEVCRRYLTRPFPIELNLVHLAFAFEVERAANPRTARGASVLNGGLGVTTAS